MNSTKCKYSFDKVTFVTIRSLLIAGLMLLTSPSYGQIALDTSRTAALGAGEMTIDEIRIADSLLIHAVNYYNNRSSRGHYLVTLSDTLFDEYRYLDSLRTVAEHFQTKKGKTKKRALKKLPKTEKETIEDLINKQDSINERIVDIMRLRKTQKEDSVVSHWGSGGTIQIANYYRQYQFWHDEEGNCHVRASCFCSEIIEMLSKTPKEHRLNWKTTPLQVYDGGNCVFTILLDISNRKATQMRVNGM